VFVSGASDVVPGDTNAWDDVFLRDRLTGTTERLSLTWDGQQIFLGAYASCQVSTDGRFVQFSSDAKEFVPDDDNHSIDAFVVDRTPGASLTSLCIPGTAGIVACPCQNPPASLDRGCDNSAATGGASMSASGGAFLSSDTLIFTSSGEPSTAASLLFQGTISSVTGATYGQGVRCAGGALRRLYSKAAAAGETRMPDRIGGDRSVSAQSAAKGEVIQSGQSRWYFVAYRDPVVLGGWSAASTFNATQVGRVDWNP